MQAMEMATLDKISLYLLQDEQFGMKAIASNEELQLVEEAIALIGTHDRDKWTRLKQKSLARIDLPISDVVSCIASAYRAPEIALSCIRDASEKAIKIFGNASKKKMAANLRDTLLSLEVVAE